MIDSLRWTVLERFVGYDSRQNFTLAFDAPAEGFGVEGRAVDDCLLEARRCGWLQGKRGEGDGSCAWWSEIRLTAAGLCELGHWPPRGQELAHGTWNEGFWQQRAVPLLINLARNPPQHGFYLREGLGDSDPQGQLEWQTLLLLLEADLMSGTVGPEGVDTLRGTPDGQEVAVRLGGG